MRALASLIIITLLLVTGGVSAADANMKPNIVILATGGTIAGRGESGTRASYNAGEVGVETLVGAVPQLAELARVRGEQVANVGSQDMSDAIWLQLAARVNAVLAEEDVAGVVITHGTDTIEETAYFLNLVVHSKKPVVLTAAMRPATALSADGPLNIYNAVAVAADPEAAGRGVLVVINDDIHGARGMTKTSTTDVQTFISPERGLIGTSLYGDNRYFRYPYKRHTYESTFDVAGRTALPRVDVLYMHAGVSPELVNASVASGAQGIVIAGVGNGNMNREVRAAVKQAVDAGVRVVRSTRVTRGFVGRNVETDDDALGTVAAGELKPPQARVLLQLALLEERDAASLQTLFEQY
ncbi:type II asparaginase [Haliea sp. E17]|uniref:type II asparaginase n=1 Tax=Haliea sp. E17 TaxID=3401576 RepID=UPI003AAA95FF